MRLATFRKISIQNTRPFMQKLFGWFAQNEMQANLSKCHVPLTATESFSFEISVTVIRNSHSG